MLNKLMAQIWISHPRSGQPDAMLTFAALAFFGVMAKFVAGGVSLTLGAKSVAFAPIDPTAAGVILGATLGAYYARKKDSPPVPAPVAA